MVQNDATEEKGFSIIIKISDDYYSASMTIIKDKECTKALNEEVLLQQIANKNITFGIKYDVVSSIAKANSEIQNVCVAEGIRHQNGENAKIDFHYNADRKAKPKLKEDGSVDFKNMDFVETINEGEVIATKILATKGKNGTTVTGKMIHGKNGKDKAFKLGKYVALSKTGEHVISEVEGILEIDNDRISILRLLEIRNDIGIETGNIEFSGDVHVYGNVLSGFSVRAEGDIVVNGIVESATIVAGGDVAITRGIQGNDLAYIESKGNMTTNFVNSATIKCSGNLETSSLIHSNVKCDGDIVVKGKRGTIVGGEVVAARNITAKVLGSELGVTTILKLGVDSQIIDEFRTLTEEVKKTKDNLDKIEKAIIVLNKKVHVNPKDMKSVALLVNYKNVKNELSEEFDTKRKRLMMLNQLINNLKNSKIQAHKLFPGSKFKIGASSYSVKDILLDVEIKKVNGEISIGSLD